MAELPTDDLAVLLVACGRGERSALEQIFDKKQGG
ncbi:hypothetical protein ABID21_004797 [Pseudorhizobium tarimense]|uniref:Uncharacterized protein n=1 Tax=Pseudorhizobium tarimense TaxID=1079109 RepID=A0ABV2HDN0_9HYPH